MSYANRILNAAFGFGATNAREETQRIAAEADATIAQLVEALEATVDALGAVEEDAGLTTAETRVLVAAHAALKAAKGEA